MGVARIAFDVREQKSQSVEEYRLRPSWEGQRSPRPNDVLVVSATSLPLGMGVILSRLDTETEPPGVVLRLVNVLGSTQKAGRFMVVVDVFEPLPAEPRTSEALAAAIEAAIVRYETLHFHAERDEVRAARLAEWLRREASLSEDAT